MTNIISCRTGRTATSQRKAENRPEPLSALTELPPSSPPNSQDQHPDNLLVPAQSSSFPLPQSQLARIADSDGLVDKRTPAARWARIMYRRKLDREEARPQTKSNEVQQSREKHPRPSEGKERQADIPENGDGRSSVRDDEDEEWRVEVDLDKEAALDEELEDPITENTAARMATPEDLPFEDGKPRALIVT